MYTVQYTSNPLWVYCLVVGLSTISLTVKIIEKISVNPIVHCDLAYNSVNNCTKTHGQVSKYVWQNNNYIICNENQRVKFFVPYVRLSRDFGSFFLSKHFTVPGPIYYKQAKTVSRLFKFSQRF